MDSPENSQPTPLLVENREQSLLRGFASMELGVVLIGILAVVLICATLFEAANGRDSAKWYFYNSSWFIALLSLLSLNVIAAILVRFPWKRRWGFLIMHCGILVLLAGAIQTYIYGIEGQLSLAEGGEKATQIQLSDRGKLTISRDMSGSGKHSDLDVTRFQPGPVDWPDGKTLYLGEQNGVKLTVLKYYSRARIEEDWIPDPTKQGGPALRFSIAHADGATMLENWLTSEPMGGQGISKLEILRAPVDSMREEFLNPPGSDKKDGEVDEKGVLSIHYDGRTQRIPVSKNIGKKIPLEGSKIEIEITKYFANAKAYATAKFESQGEEPRNPLLDLLIYLPGEEKPVRELAFSKMPLMSLASMHGKECPVKFWYHQPALPAPIGADFLQTPDGKLYSRVGLGGKYVSRGEVKAGSKVEIAESLRLNILKYLPSAIHKVIPHPVKQASNKATAADAAALVEVDFGGAKQSVWLVRNDPNYSYQLITAPKGNLAIHFGYDSEPLGYSLKLLKFTREVNPGNMGDAAFISSVQLVDEPNEIDREQKISMNQPLTYGKYTFYQSSFNDLPNGEKISILSVAYDPGRFLKYLGSLMICGGMAMRYLTSFRKKRMP